MRAALLALLFCGPLICEAQISKDLLNDKRRPSVEKRMMAFRSSKDAIWVPSKDAPVLVPELPKSRTLGIELHALQVLRDQEIAQNAALESRLRGLPTSLNVVLDREFPNPTCRPHVPWRTTAQVPILNARRVQEAGQMSLHAGGVEPAVLARPKSYIQQVRPEGE